MRPRRGKIYRMALPVLTAGTALSAPQMTVSAMEEAKVRELSEQIGAQYCLCPELLQAIAQNESGYDETAQADGCIGLMQVSKRWHRDRMERLKVADLLDPESNMLVATDYLSELFLRYEDIGMVLMVYSGDSGAEAYARTGEGLSAYAQEIMEQAAQLEMEHGK